MGNTWTNRNSKFIYQLDFTDQNFAIATAWKVFVFGVILVHIFPDLD